MELANGKVNKLFTLPDKGENRYYVDDFDADEDKYNNNVYLLTQYIPEGAVVLDIGCGSGKFGRKLKEKECIVYGLERDSKAAECAMKTGCYKEIFECDITEEDCDEYKRFLKVARDIDIIILSDILEHLEDPTGLLLKCNAVLKENGHILVSVPNVAHADISLNLLNGKFNYTDMGILDNTHLKFFTKSSFLEWIGLMNESFSEVNFEVEYVGGTFYNNEFLNKIKEKYEELYEVIQYATTYNTFQLLFKISKRPQGQELSKIKDVELEKANDIVDILGKRLKGEAGEITNVPSLLKGERLEYEKQVKSLNESVCKQQEYINSLEAGKSKQQEYINSLEAGKDKQQQYINNLESDINKQKEYIETINKSLSWYKDNEQAKEKQMEEQSNYISALKESVEWYEEQTKRINEEKGDTEKYIKALEESIKWHENNQEEMRTQMEAKDKTIEEISLEKQQVVMQLQSENESLSTRLIEMEKSICFKVYKFFKNKGRRK